MKQYKGTFTTNPEDLRNSTIKIVTVPTPINDAKQPDLTILKHATTTVGSNLKKGDIVIYESTVYPGVTDDICIPLLEET